MKQKLDRAGEYERRATSSSPPTTNAPLLSSPETRDRSLSTGASLNTSFVPHSQMSVTYQDPFAQQYGSAYDSQFPAGSEAYLKQPMAQMPTSFTYSGYPQSVSAGYASFPQNTAYAEMRPMNVPYPSSTNQGQYSGHGSTTTTTTGHLITPITPTSQVDSYPQDAGSQYGVDFPRPYDNTQVSTSQAYSVSTTSVNHPPFFRQNYPSS